ncbi:transmembrane emp24 domain-containing protein 1-like protein [Sarcoptes scabiei]|uniref:Transmembrane emp24 domain-containing protein 1-like protein n=1 Tax=Sarcoptes scabiei TaxID=52283 RepID=A0A131ZU61_SARSC|nr:transmembrane emp24 domain-containing protein 1-like protein [Sarcoptes scabiei]
MLPKENLKYFALFVWISFRNFVAKAENYTPEMSQDNLGTAYEFKIHIDAGKEDCFYQYIEAGSSLYIAFQVVRGGDSMAGFYVNGPTNQPIMPYQWKQHAEIDDSNVLQTGYYSLCIDNKPSSFHSKLVSLYLASLKRDEWDKYIKELSDSDVSVSNVTSMLRNVQLNINEVVKKLEHSRQKHTYDLYLADSNNRYVQNWSLIHCVVVIACSIVQVIFVRKLFESNEFKKGKVRA